MEMSLTTDLCVISVEHMTSIKIVLLVFLDYSLMHTVPFKTKYMMVSALERRSTLYNLCIGDNSFDAVNTFKYLGNMIDNEGSINTIHDTIQIGNRPCCLLYTSRCV